VFKESGAGLPHIISVNLCSLLDFLTLEAGTNRLCRQFCAELPLYAGNISLERGLQVFWRCRTWFGPAWPSSERYGLA